MLFGDSLSNFYSNCLLMMNLSSNNIRFDNCRIARSSKGANNNFSISFEINRLWNMNGKRLDGMVTYCRANEVGTALVT
jgi:hypothetical protein